MGVLWIQNNRLILNSNGTLSICDNCPCVPTVGECPTDCSSCDTPLTLTVSDLIGNCTDLNGNITLNKYFGVSCIWSGSKGGTSCVTYSATLTCDEDGKWHISINATSCGEDNAFNAIWQSEGRTGANCPPLGSYIMVEAYNDLCIGSPVPTVVLS